VELAPGAEPQQGPADRFTGEVFATGISGPADHPARLASAFVRFAPGAHTNWHVHHNGQILHVLSGTALVVTRDGSVIRARPGETVRCLPGEEHWHGATPDETMTHLAMVVAPADRDGTTWLEPVPAEAYRAAAGA
jgi:quercetin dioxygenase-like cupin family protein